MPGSTWPTALKRLEQEGLTPGADYREALGIEPISMATAAIQSIPLPAF